MHLIYERDVFSEDLDIRWLAFYAKVTLDGKPVQHCLEVNEEAGYVVVFRRNKEGKLVVNPKKGNIQRKRLHGVVKITNSRADHENIVSRVFE